MIRIRVPDMTCCMCFKRVEEAISHVRGVENVMVNPETKEVRVEGKFEKEEVLSAIRAAGYTPEE
ncbi:MAG: heavy metal-associated domain-containing protein [candidate division WOR-3 bacterium]